MSEIKSFTFASGRAKGAKSAGKFEVNGESFEVRVLKDSNIAYLVAAVNGAGDAMKIISRVLDFMERALVPESAKRFESLVLDPDAGLEISQVVEVFQHVLGMVAGGEDPTGSSSGSSARRPRTGASSTAASRTTR